MAEYSVAEQIREKEREIQVWKARNPVGKLVGGIICTVIGASGMIMSIVFVFSYWRMAQAVGSFSRYLYGQSGWEIYRSDIIASIIGAIVMFILMIVGICLIKSYTSSNRERNDAIFALQADIGRLRLSAGQEAADSGRWMCSCGRVNEPYVGTCACGRTRASLKKREMERERQKTEREAAERRRREQEEAERQLREKAPMEDQQTIDFNVFRELKGLLDDGIITQEEFDRKKKDLLRML